MSKHYRRMLWGKPLSDGTTKLLVLRDGELFYLKHDERTPVAGLPDRRWTYDQAQEWAAMTGFAPVERGGTNAE